MGARGIAGGVGAWDAGGNQERMEHPACVKEGLVIGSGAAESACQGATGAQLKGTGCAGIRRMRVAWRSGESSARVGFGRECGSGDGLLSLPENFSVGHPGRRHSLVCSTPGCRAPQEEGLRYDGKGAAVRPNLARIVLREVENESQSQVTCIRELAQVRQRITKCTSSQLLLRIGLCQTGALP